MQGQKALAFHQKCLDLCSEDDEGFTGLEQHEGEKFITEFSFLCEQSLLVNDLSEGYMDLFYTFTF